jgi:hypothetical protein
MTSRRTHRLGKSGWLLVDGCLFLGCVQIYLQAGDLVAVRLGPWKLHFTTKGSHCNDNFPDAECYAPSNDRRDAGGLLFNVERDMSEVLPVANHTFEYKLWAPVLWTMAYDYAQKMSAAPSEIDKGGAASRFPCCQQCTPMPTCCACNRTSPVYLVSEL